MFLKKVIENINIMLSSQYTVHPFHHKNGFKNSSAGVGSIQLYSNFCCFFSV